MPPYLVMKEAIVGFFSDIFSDGDRSSPQNISRRIRELERRANKLDVAAIAQLSCYRQTGEVGQLYFMDDHNR